MHVILPHLDLLNPRVALAFLSCALALAFSVACGSSAQTPIVFTSDRDGDLEIYSVDPETKTETNLTDSPRGESSPLISPDGKLIAFQSALGDSVAIEIMDITGTSRSSMTPGTGRYGSHRWSPESDRIAYIQEGTEGPVPYVANADATGRLLLASVPGDEIGGWSPDGESVVFAVRSGDAQGIYIRNPTGVNEFKVTDTPDYQPVWSPDSDMIAFISTRDGNPEIYVMNADGSKEGRLTETGAAEYHLSWSPNGKQLLFVSERDGNPEIYTTSLDGLDQERLTRNTTRDDQPVWSPGGDKIAFVSYLDGDAEIFVMDDDGRHQDRLTNNDAEDTSPSW